MGFLLDIFRESLFQDFFRFLLNFLNFKELVHRISFFLRLFFNVNIFFNRLFIDKIFNYSLNSVFRRHVKDNVDIILEFSTHNFSNLFSFLLQDGRIGFRDWLFFYFLGLIEDRTFLLFRYFDLLNLIFENKINQLFNRFIGILLDKGDVISERLLVSIDN